MMRTASGEAAHARVLADIGGTHARFAWQQGPGEPLDVLTLQCAHYQGVSQALRAALQCWDRSAPRHCGIAIANPVAGDVVRMTNRDWTFSISALKGEFGFRQLVVLNDFTALAGALPLLGPEDLRQLGGGAPEPGAPRAVIGPGTGLGVSGLLWTRNGDVALEGEGGHATLAAATPREHQVLAWLMREHGHVSAERVLSGQGLVNLHAAVRALAGVDAAPCSAAGITASALARKDPHCLEALELFCAFLGTMAGNLALTLGARGGVYLGGGIVPRLGRFIDASQFRARFDGKGRLRGYLSRVPVFVICAPQSPALRGIASVLDAA